VTLPGLPSGPFRLQTHCPISPDLAALEWHSGTGHSTLQMGAASDLTGLAKVAPGKRAFEFFQLPQFQ